MSGRGGYGRGRGRGRGVYRQYKPPVPFVLFPENNNLPDVKLNEIDACTKRWLKGLYDFANYYKVSPYYMEEAELKGRKRGCLERYSDKKNAKFTRDSLSQVLHFGGFSKELVSGKSKQVQVRKKFRWNPESDVSVADGKKLNLNKLNMFEQKEKEFQGREGKEEKDDESEDEDEDKREEDEEEEEDLGDGDYNQNLHDFDDDEDDFNVEDDVDDEPTY